MKKEIVCAIAYLGFVAIAAAQTQPVTATDAKTNYIPVFTGNSTIGSSSIAQSDRRIGIGTPNPNAQLSVASPDINQFVSTVMNSKGDQIFGVWNQNNGGATVELRDGDSKQKIFLNTTGNSWFTSGNLGIGTAAPKNLLQVGEAYSQNPSIMIGGQDGDSSSMGRYSLLFGAYRDVESITSGIVATPVWVCCGGYPSSGYPGVRVNTLGFYTVYNPENPTTYSPNLLIDGAGNVGVGTINPVSKLDVQSGNLHTSPGYGLVGNPSGSILTADDGLLGAKIYAGNGGQITFGQGSTELVRIMADGRMGIGTPLPGRTLHVKGDVQIDGNLYFGSNPQAQGEAYAGVKCGGDYAESVDVTGDRNKYEPGDVLVIDPSNAGKFLKSAEPYSTSVMGIYSTKPGVLGRRQKTEKSPDEIPMAMVGIVPTKVSAENGPIRPGDLLVSSSTLGYAMKGTDRGRMLGAIVGKALGSLAAGTGMIEVGVTLQ